MKTYCDRCKAIDSDKLAMVDLSLMVTHFSSLSLSVRDKYLAKDKKLMKAIGRFPKVLTFCADCFIEFFDYKNQIKDEAKLTPNELPIPNETKLAGYSGDGVSEANSENKNN